MSAAPDITNRAISVYSGELVFERWGRQESYPLGVQVTYPGGTLAAAYSEERAVVLSSFYVESAKELAVRRVVLSGYRLADVLTALLPMASEALTNTKRQSAADLLHLAAAASFSHFLTKLFLAAPAAGAASKDRESRAGQG